MTLRYTAPYFEWIDGSGVPLAGGKLYFYASGTDTPLATYSDSALTIANANPVIANADGYWGSIFLQPVDYKVILKTAADVQIWSADPVNSSGSSVIRSNIRTITTSQTILIQDGTVLCDTLGGNIVLTLLAPSSCTGIIYTVKNIGTGYVTVAGLIDGRTNYALAFLNESVSVQSNGTSYDIV